MQHFEDILQVVLSTPRKSPNHPLNIWGIPTCFIGEVGAAKSERIEQACRTLRLPLHTILPAGRMPEDFSGVLVNTPQGLESVCALPEVRSLIDTGYGVLFFDELTTARPTVQGALLGVFNSRQVGDVRLSGRVRVLAAMNPPEYASGGFEITAPLANRMAHFHYEVPSDEDWSSHLLETSKSVLTSYDDAEAVVAASWDACWAEARALGTSFISAKPRATTVNEQGKFSRTLHAQPLPDSPDASGPWPSLRTWEWALRGIATRKALGKPEALDYVLMRGLLGEAPALEFTAWRRTVDLMSPQEVLAGRWKPSTSRLDVVSAVLANTTLYALANPDDDKLAALWGVIDQMIDLGLADTVLQHANKLSSHHAEGPLTVKASKKPLIKLYDLKMVQLA